MPIYFSTNVLRQVSAHSMLSEAIVMCVLCQRVCRSKCVFLQLARILRREPKALPAPWFMCAIDSGWAHAKIKRSGRFVGITLWTSRVPSFSKRARPLLWQSPKTHRINTYVGRTSTSYTHSRYTTRGKQITDQAVAMKLRRSPLQPVFTTWGRFPRRQWVAFKKKTGYQR